MEMQGRTIYEARVAVTAAGLDTLEGLQETCCVVSLKHEEPGSNLLLQERCSGWRTGAAPVYSSPSRPFSLLVGDGDLAAVSDASVMLTLYGRVQRPKPGALLRCLAQHITTVEVLLRQELPLQQVLMAATMSRVQQLALPSGGALRCEVALSHPQHGSSLLVGCHGSGGEGLQVADQEENEVMSVQAVRLGPSRTTHEAKRRNSGAAGNWVATDAATGKVMPAASPLYELQVHGAGQREAAEEGGEGGEGSAPPAARCRMEPSSERYSVLVRDLAAPEGYSCWGVLSIQHVNGPTGPASLQLLVPSLPGLQLSSATIMPVARSILGSNSTSGSSSLAAPSLGATSVNKVHPNSSSNSSAGAAGSAAHIPQQPLGMRYVLRQMPPAARKSLDRPAAGAAATAGVAAATSSGGSSPRKSQDGGAAEPLAVMAVASRQQQHGTQQGGGDGGEQPPVFAVEMQKGGGKHAAALVCLAALLAELT